jgi:hypothetical protein
MKSHRSTRRRTARAARSSQRSHRLIEALEGRTLLAADTSLTTWHNPFMAEDVNGDATVTPSDVLTVLDAINRIGAGPLPLSGGGLARRTSGSAAMSAGQYLDVTGDGVLAPDDVLRVLDHVNRGLVGGGIAADPATPWISVSDAQLAEDGGSMIFTVSLSNASAEEINVGFATQDNTALAGLDYTAQSGQLTFAPGSTQLQVAVPVIADVLAEPDETFFLVISSPINAQILDEQGVGTILANSAAAVQIETRFEIRDAGNNVVPDGGTIHVGDSFTFLVYVDDVSAADEGVLAAYLDVAYTASVLGAVGPISYNSLYDTAQQGNFATDGLIDEAGATNINGAPGPGEVLLFSIPMIAEAGGLATLTGNPADLVGNESGVYPATPVSPGQIFYDSVSLNVEEIANSITIDSVSIVEGDSGTTAFTFTVTRNNPTADVATVQFATSNGTATLADNDYVATSGTLTFAVGDNTETITVLVNGDGKIEADETFLVTLSNPSNAVLGLGVGTGTILNDDEVPVIAGFVYVDANNDGIKSANEVGLPGVIVTITSEDGLYSDWTTTDATGRYEFDGLAVDQYYITETQPGFYGDGLDTPSAFVSANDKFYIDLLSDTSIPDLNFGETGILPEFLAAALNRRVFFSTTVDNPINGLTSPIVNANLTRGDLWVSFDGGWDGLRKFQAYSAQGSVTLKLYDLNRFGKLHLLATSQLVNGIPEISWVDTPEAPATPLFLQITGTSTNASVKIIDTLRVVAQSVAEGNFGATNQTLTVKLSGRQTAPVVVQYATANDVAVSPDDFTAVSGTLTFDPGETTKTITVPVLGDVLDENNETFLVNLTGASSFVEVAPGPFKIAITDDDQAPRVKITDVAIAEGDGGAANAVFNVILSSASGREVTVAYTTAAGTASSGGDFTPVSGTVTFAPGTLAQLIAVPILGDTFLETDESFSVVLGSAVNANILDGIGLGTIVNDDAGPQFLPPPGGTSGGLLASSESSESSVAADADVAPATTSVAVAPAAGYTRPISSRGRSATRAVDAALAEEEDWLLIA